MKYLLLVCVLFTITLCTRVETTSFYKDKIGYGLKFRVWSGYNKVDWYYPEETAAMYYSFWQEYGSTQTDPTKNKYVPVIIWLQGGPGAASQFGCFNELGPIHILGDKTFTLQQNGHSWNVNGHLVCVDQPIGIGFSYNRGPLVTDTIQASKHFTNFLYNFLTEWNLWQNPLYISGESYAGHYIPAFADTLLSNTTSQFNIQGIMIGDGYLDPINQVNFYDSTLYSLGVASDYARDVTTYTQNQALISLLNNRYEDASGWTNWIIDNDDTINKFYGGLNVMNYKKYSQDNINDNYWKFLQQNKKIHGVPDDVNYVEDGDFMYQAFSRDISVSFAENLTNILKRGVKTLIYNGQNDVIVNTAGVLNYLNNLDWEGTRAWSKTPKQQWFLYGGKTNVGWKKSYANLNFVLIKDAGHLVPADQGAAASQMIRSFISGI